MIHVGRPFGFLIQSGNPHRFAVRVLPFEMIDLFDLKTLFQRMGKNFSQVPVLQPVEFFPYFIRVNGWGRPFGQIFQIVFQVSQSLQKCRL